MQNENINKETEINVDELTFEEKWNKGLLEKEEYDKIVNECLELMD